MTWRDLGWPVCDLDTLVTSNGHVNYFYFISFRCISICCHKTKRMFISRIFEIRSLSLRRRSSYKFWPISKNIFFRRLILFLSAVPKMTYVLRFAQDVCWRNLRRSGFRPPPPSRTGVKKGYKESEIHFFYCFIWKIIDKCQNAFRRNFQFQRTWGQGHVT